ncbi:hypothetical protein EOJ41_15215 [Vibrio alginolyticus]|uniref:type II toxin-antitoxin system YafO family toxin n=1 Tax=Vibrio alginolyticus TaxID=663 RepID=UPI00102DBF82|nr:type II toxin-antitoxin system YafO family toxin [Vibrio alginolyticus]RZV17356.1 hypothetical protein EOJ41_15215 [Vibrio alginolyticus]
MSKLSSSNVYVHYDSEELDPLSPAEEFALKEFKQYKIDSISITSSNFVAPNEGIQETTPSCHELFGRDRVFEHPSHLITHIHKEHLAHVHYSNGKWDSTKPQWSCTSNLAIVYSGFIVDQCNYHFVVHELLLDDKNQNIDAHDFYKNDDVDYYVRNARYLREELTSE